MCNRTRAGGWCGDDSVGALPLPQPRLGGRGVPFWRQAQVLVGQAGGQPPAGGALEEAQLEQVRLVHVHDGVRLLRHRGGQSLQPHGAAVELLYQRAQELVVQLVQPQLNQAGRQNQGHAFKPRRRRYRC